MMKKKSLFDSLTLHVGDGAAYVKPDGRVTLGDCEPIEIKEMEMVLREAKAFKAYVQRRGKA
jgi:hypothetical protein